MSPSVGEGGGARWGVTLRLKGGLGNQLFQYAAARLLAARSASGLRIDVGEATLTHDGIGILATEIPEAMVRPVPAFPRPLRWAEARALRLRRRWDGEPVGRSIHTCQALQMALDTPSTDPTTVDGFFQSPVIVDQAEHAGLPLLHPISRPSRWLTQMLRRAEDDPPLVVHVRRGDYTQSLQWGLLGEPYYREALTELAPTRQTPIWVFSDDPGAAWKLLHRLAPSAPQLIRPPSTSPAVESLLLMTRGSALVCANSTFSWWAARLTDCPVVVPTPFHRQNSESEDLTSPSGLRLGWTAVASRFLTPREG